MKYFKCLSQFLQADKGKEGNSSPKEDSKENLEIFVGNMPFSATEDMIEEFFSKYGEITSVKILQRVFV